MKINGLMIRSNKLFKSQFAFTILYYDIENMSILLYLSRLKEAQQVIINNITA